MAFQRAGEAYRRAVASSDRAALERCLGAQAGIEIAAILRRTAGGAIEYAVEWTELQLEPDQSILVLRGLHRLRPAEDGLPAEGELELEWDGPPGGKRLRLRRHGGLFPP